MEVYCLFKNSRALHHQRADSKRFLEGEQGDFESGYCGISVLTHLSMIQKPPYYIVGNWKMHGLRSNGPSLARGVVRFLTTNPLLGVQVVVCPPSTLLAEVSEVCQESVLSTGGQDCHAQESGAFTGDVSAAMLADAGAHYAIVGHSERRMQHAETDEQVHAKAEAALSAGLKPIVCVGETLQQRESGMALEVVAQQVKASVPGGATIVAYEPVWAIGTGKAPSMDDIAAMHARIQSLLSPGVAVLYGGSVKPANAAEILAIDGVGGVLVGGASLQLDDFCAIVAAAKELQE